MSKKYRVGRKQGRVVLDENGIVVVEFPFGMEKDAKEYCEWRNQKAGKSIAFFDGIKELYGIDVPEEDWGRFAVSASLVVNDLRLVHLRHPDQKMVESSCLHFLGDDAQIWWANRKKKLKPLSELHKDEEACRRVRDLITGPTGRIEYLGDRTCFGGSSDDADIFDNGEFTDEVFGRRVNIFALVDLIRELGYEPEKK